MPRIQLVPKDTGDPAVAKLLSSIEKTTGSVPNLIATMANSAPVANAYINFTKLLSGGELPARQREQIALTVGEANQCNYCLAAHSLMAKGTGLSDQQIVDARRGEASDSREKAALVFAMRIIEDRGIVSERDFEAIQDAGYTDGQIVEIVANVAVNIFTNYFNHIAGTEVDFPAAPKLAVA